MRNIIDIVKGGAVLAIVVAVGWLVIKVVIWIFGIIGGIFSWFFNDLLSEKNFDSFGSMFAWGGVILLAWLIGRAIRKK
jgi:hypothetical protein